ncbi:MAG: oxidoreductase, partial [Anaerolineae bacterium]|nr:oxidoreductase [Anaerolineae bacterium]
PAGCKGETGFISAEVLSHHKPEAAKAVYFVCGPLPMIRFVTKALATLQVPDHQIYVEQYEMA